MIISTVTTVRGVNFQNSYFVAYYLASYKYFGTNIYVGLDGAFLGITKVQIPWIKEIKRNIKRKQHSN
jgi:hypothetical protein